MNLNKCLGVFYSPSLPCFKPLVLDNVDGLNLLMTDTPCVSSAPLSQFTPLSISLAVLKLF